MPFPYTHSGPTVTHSPQNGYVGIKLHAPTLKRFCLVPFLDLLVCGNNGDLSNSGDVGDSGDLGDSDSRSDTGGC